MRILLRSPAVSGDTHIPPGEYSLSLQSETRMLNLSGGGKDYRLPVTHRPNRGVCRMEDAQLLPAGGKLWDIVVKTPKRGEWIARIRYED